MVILAKPIFPPLYLLLNATRACPQYILSVSCCQNSVLCSCECIMSQLSEFKRRQIVGARILGAFITQAAGMFGVSRVTV